MNNFLTNLALRIIALLCAILLWFYATLNKKYETTITMPIRLVNIQDNIAPANAFPLIAKVLVSGTGRQLFMLKFYDAELLVNGEKAILGVNIFKVSGENVEIRGNPGVRVLFVKDPVQLTINFDAIIKKEIPVISDINIVTAQDRILEEEPRLSPDRITLSGPRCNVSEIDTMRTRHVEALGVGKDTAFFAFVRQPGLFGVEFVPNKIRVNIKVATVKKRRMEGIPIRLIGTPSGVEARLNVKTVSLTVAGVKRDVDSLKRESINVFVNYSRFSLEQEEEVEPVVSIIGNVTWSNLDPKTVRLMSHALNGKTKIREQF